MKRSYRKTKEMERFSRKKLCKKTLKKSKKSKEKRRDGKIIKRAEEEMQKFEKELKRKF